MLQVIHEQFQEGELLPIMHKSNFCTAVDCTLKWGLVAPLEAEVPQWRSECGQGTEHPAHEITPSGVASSFTLRVGGTRCTSQVAHANV